MTCNIKEEVNKPIKTVASQIKYAVVLYTWIFMILYILVDDIHTINMIKALDSAVES